MNQNEITLEDIKKIEFGILSHFRDFCEENNITYFLSNGTLLGSVKYNGFIPWDDDIDVFIPRQDYERFVKLYEDTEQYKLFEISRTSKYIFPFAKMCDTTTLKVEYDYNNKCTMGLDIDIFPLDYWHNSKKLLKMQCRIQMFYMRVFDLARRVKSPKSFTQNPIKYCIYKLCSFLGARFIAKLMIKTANISARNRDNCEFSGCVVWPVYGLKEVVPITVFKNKVDVAFENGLFTAPEKYDIYLTSLYGDYNEDPPIEKQKSHHRFKSYFINN